MKKYCLSIGVLLLVVAFLVGCVPAAPAPPAPVAPAATPAAPALSPEEASWAKVVQEARKDGILTMYGSSSQAGDIGKAIGEAFMNRYGIRIELLNLRGRTGLEKIRVEQQIKKPVADVGEFGMSAAWDLARLGLVDNVANELPVLRNRDVFNADVVDMGGQLLYTSFSQSDLMINSKLVKPEDYPQSYFDLLGPKWKGTKILLQDPTGGGSGTWSWFVTSTFFKALDFDYFRQIMKQQPAMSGAATAQLGIDVARGEYLMAVSGSDSHAFQVVEGAPLKFLALKEGSWLSAPAVVVIKNVTHPNAARLYANWILSQEGQTVWARAASRTPVRKDVPDFSQPGIRPEPKKAFVRTTETMDYGLKLLEAGTVKEIFTPK